MSGSSSSKASHARLVQLLTPAVEQSGHVLEDLSVSPAGKRQVVRVLVDSQGPVGITLDDVAAVSRRISDLLDTAEQDEPDLLGGAYVLEVSSPGVDRPLTLPRHWKRSVRRLVLVALADGTTVTGRVTSADELEVVLDVDGAERRLLLAEVLSGAVQVEFSRPGEPDLEADEDVIEDDEEDDA